MNTWFTHSVWRNERSVCHEYIRRDGDQIDIWLPGLRINLHGDFTVTDVIEVLEHFRAIPRSEAVP